MKHATWLEIYAKWLASALISHPRWHGGCDPGSRELVPFVGRKGIAKMELDRAKQQSEQISGVSNIAYDLMAVMTNKLEGIAAMEEYKLDAEDAGDTEVQDLLNLMEQQEVSDVDKIKKLLLQRLK